METVAEPLSQWICSSSDSAIPRLPFCAGAMDDLPFSLEDLPPEIRDKIDEIIDKNVDLDTQLDAIDELLFARQPQANFDANIKFDHGNESGIGSDSDSGNGVLPATDPLTRSPATPAFPRPTEDDVIINPRIFDTRASNFPAKQYGDDFISRLIVPPPPTLPRPASPRLAQYANFEQRAGTVSSASSRGSNLLSGAPSSGRFSAEDDLPLPPPPLGFGGTPEKSFREQELPEHQTNQNPEQVKVVRTGENFHVTLGVPRGPWGTLPDPSLTRDANLNVSRVLVREPDRSSSGESTVQYSNVVQRFSQGVPAVQSRSTSSVPKTVSLSRSSSRSELYAWEEFPALRVQPDSISAGTGNVENIARSESNLATGKVRRPSELSLASSLKTKFVRRKDDTDTDSVSTYVSTPSRYSKASSGSTVDLRRKKWRPLSEFLSRSTADAEEHSRSSGDGESDSDAGEDRSADRAGEEAPGGSRRTADDGLSGLSGLVQMRAKNGRPAHLVKVDARTLKAHSMLSLYDPASDYREKSKTQKSAKKKAKRSPSKTRFSVLFQRKRKSDKKTKVDKDSKQSCDNGNNNASSRHSDSELQRSDYLFPSTPAPLPPALTRHSIPSPSVYGSTPASGSTAARKRTSPLPGEFSALLRSHLRDIDLGDPKPCLTFSTFRGEIKPVRWTEEETRRLTASGGWANSPTLERSPFALGSRYSLPANVDVLLPSRSDATTGAPRHNGSQHGSRMDLSVVSKQESLGQNSHKNDVIGRSNPPHILIVNGQTATAPPPVIKVTTPPPLSATDNTPQPPKFKVAAQATRATTPTIQSQPGSSTRPTSLHGVPHPPLQTSNSSPRVTSRQATPAQDTRQQSSNALSPPSTPIRSNSAEALAKTKAPGSVSEESKVLQTTYDDDTGCRRAVTDLQRMLSNFLADRGRLLSAPTAGASTALFASQKDSLSTHTRHLVTDAKMMVSGATRSTQDLTRALTTAVHTVSRVFESCRLMASFLPPGGRRTMLTDEVLHVGRIFFDTLTSSTVAAGRRQDDPAMELLMRHTTDLAHALGRLVNTIKCLDCDLTHCAK